MEFGVDLKPRRRLKDINVFEVSFVDKAANGRKFLVFKRLEGGGDLMEDTKFGGALDENITQKEDEEKIKEADTMDEDARYIELKKEIDRLRETIEELKRGVPVRKGLQETEEPRPRKSPKDAAISLLKSSELRAKMTHAHAPSPTQWARELLNDA